MLDKILRYSIEHKFLVFLFTLAIIAFGIYSLLNIPIGAVPDITNNQVQIISTSRNLATQDVEKFLTYPVELEMANLPGVKEIRSVSKFGLSVVTVVFEDAMGTYLPRQLIAEKIKSAEEKIPTGFGQPFMGPVTTGLGEIYQYVIDVDSAYKDQYSITELRTIQDWIIKRQLSGIPGVVEVNTWGGYLKQYEVAVNPEKLKAMNISLFSVYDALASNNGIAGGSYIEKGQESYFIRGEGLIGSIEDIENIVVERRNSNPILIRDLAEVGFGSANRFGAITGNGEGEKVLGQVMMLKDANTKAVIEAVKERVAELESSLPPGVHVNPILERSELLEKTTFTIAENLILGCLIVIFVVVLLLGNWRSALVVASVIPLCLMFALSMMYVFGVDANLMSLGAIDFGIIIDGAVIIVEFIAYKITSESASLLNLNPAEKSKRIDEITFQGASKMMHSAIFGQLIIILVFIPIFSLANVEGKMFKPMALVFCFALIGAILLCFTYVPVMASLFIKPNGDPNKKGLANKLLDFLQRMYEPSITWALKNKTIVLSLAFSLLLGVMVLFSTMGGEFVPTLDEGDFVIQPVLKTGTSLSATIEITTQIEKILKEFPEVDQVVSRIGAAEVPTDPMSMEESDVIIKLRPQSEWTSAKTKDELADLFKAALLEIPGVDYEFTQPIEMRFNELITGVRADLAIKVFGEDLDILYAKGLEIQKAIEGIDGAADITLEKVAGLPQMSVVFDREKIAKYGLNIDELNRLISVSFAGLSAGTIFEGEKQFDLVLRYDEFHRKDLENIENASIFLDNGLQIPLSEFAKISYTTGPAKISRDNTKRRIVIGVNVRNRDLESVVSDVQAIIAKEIDLPIGYTIEYGGQFENLRTAKARLMLAVPVALVLIFVLLFFAFDSFKDALMIYSAIPLSAVGGVLLLYLRDMPFSISAGVGFIALFGIAVLNGIVLIEQFKELKDEGVSDIYERILLGTKLRLRPVLLTASAAALGFLPMAISSSSGAEVQRPLASVVVGGLISATLLTLLVLPVLYAIFENFSFSKFRIKAKSTSLLLVFFIGSFSIVHAQKELSLEQAIELGLSQNQGLASKQLQLEQAKQLVSGFLDLEKTDLYYSYDQNNIAPNNAALYVWGISQNMQFPTLYASKRNLLKKHVTLSEQELSAAESRLKKELSQAYFTVLYWQRCKISYQYLDSLYAQFSMAASRKFELGESNYLEKMMASSKQQELGLKLAQSEDALNKALAKLEEKLQNHSMDYKLTTKFQKLALLETSFSESSAAKFLEAKQEQAAILLSLSKQSFLPDLKFSYFQGTNKAPEASVYRGFQVGIGLPIFFFSNKAEIQAAKTSIAISNAEKEQYRVSYTSNLEALYQELHQFELALNLFETNNENLAKLMVQSSSKAYQSGEIDFMQFIQFLDQAKSMELEYLDNLLQYNLTVLEINYLGN
ncbi:MAG: CusA/CzcA family heavy metal efflux RND transporter [Chitinophagales bacterium]|nr:CusA/CzcA family heavy metal efflux RND transporter [Chitinophagales bacterium]